MADFYDRSGLITPPPSEDGRCHSADDPGDVNNNSTTPFPTLITPPTPPTTNRRRDRLSLQKEREANRSKQFTTRLQRSSSEGKDKDGIGKGKRNFQQRQRNSLSSEGSNGEADDQKGLTKMAFAEQQKWITVQQKTFTKWWVGLDWVRGIGAWLIGI